MNSALLGLVAALSWGLHDFLARFPSRAVGPIPTVFAVTLAGLIVLSVWLLFDGGGISIVWPSLWLVAVTGIFFTLATLSLFAALAVGPISIVAPIAGSYPALAMIFAMAQGARPGLWQWVAIAAVMTGVAIVSRSGRHYEASGDLERGRLKGILGLAFLAGFCFAVALTAGQAAVPIFGEVETVWLARCFGLVTIGALYLWRPAKAPLPLRWFPVLGFMGLLDVIALGTIVAAGNLPDPAFATVVSSAFGAVTVLLARIFLKEPVTPAQFGGMALIFGGSARLPAFNRVLQSAFSAATICPRHGGWAIPGEASHERNDGCIGCRAACRRSLPKPRRRFREVSHRRCLDLLGNARMPLGLQHAWLRRRPGSETRCLRGA